MSAAVRYLDIAGCEAACRACPHYGLRWGCPPYPDGEGLRIFTSYRYLTLISVTSDGGADEIRRVIEPRIVQAEIAAAGRMAALPGECPYCLTDCSRIDGRPCRNPHKLRPSLEALGFDVVRLVHDVQGITYEWDSDKLTVTAALAHDLASAEIGETLKKLSIF